MARERVSFVICCLRSSGRGAGSVSLVICYRRARWVRLKKWIRCDIYCRRSSGAREWVSFSICCRRFEGIRAKKRVSFVICFRRSSGGWGIGKVCHLLSSIQEMSVEGEGMGKPRHLLSSIQGRGGGKGRGMG